jgi:hypothetical protein
MFRGSQLEHYFNRMGSSKLVSTGTSSSGYETSINLPDPETSSNPSIIVLGSSSESNASNASTLAIREFQQSDPRYLHPPRPVAKRSRETTDSVCNQPRKRTSRSNPAVKLIALRDAPLIDLTCPIDRSSNLELNSDSGPFREIDEQIETYPNVLEWISVHEEEKVSYEATRRFQESWAAKLPWAECVKGGDGLYDFVCCMICTMFEVRTKILRPKWDTLKKHGGKRKAKHNMPRRGIRAGQWYIAINCKHLINERR